MSLKIKLISCISAFVVVLSLMLISVFSATNVTLNIGGNVSFNANSINAYITGSIAGNASGGSTFTPIDIDASDSDGAVSMPSDWTNMDLTFTENASPITVTINIQNRSTDRIIAVSLTDNTNISNVTVTRECDSASIKASDNRNIPGGETITYTFKLSVQSQNSSASGKFLINYELNNGEEVAVEPDYFYGLVYEITGEDTVNIAGFDYNAIGDYGLDPFENYDAVNIIIPPTVSLVYDEITLDMSESLYEKEFLLGEAGSDYRVTGINDGAFSYVRSYCPGFQGGGVLDFSNCIYLETFGEGFSRPFELDTMDLIDFSGCINLVCAGNAGEDGDYINGAWTFSGLIKKIDFSECTSLTSVPSVYSDSTELIIDFDGCTSLSTIKSEDFAECPAKIISFANCNENFTIERRAFVGCYNLETVILPSGMRYNSGYGSDNYEYVFGYSISDDAFDNYPSLSDISGIDESVEETRLHNESSWLVYVKIGDRVESLYPGQTIHIDADEFTISSNIDGSVENQTAIHTDDDPINHPASFPWGTRYIMVRVGEKILTALFNSEIYGPDDGGKIHVDSPCTINLTD